MKCDLLRDELQRNVVILLPSFQHNLVAVAGVAGSTHENSMGNLKYIKR